MEIKINLYGNYESYMVGDDVEYDCENIGIVTINLPMELLKNNICDYFDLDKNEQTYDILEKMEDYYIESLENDKDFINELKEYWEQEYNDNKKKYKKYVEEIEMTY